MHGNRQASRDQIATPHLIALSHPSPAGGVAPVAFTILNLSSAGWNVFSSSLQPLPGEVGALLATVSVSCAADRISRPLVLCALGRHVYPTLQSIFGTTKAAETASDCLHGQAPSREHLGALLSRSGRFEGQHRGEGV